MDADFDPIDLTRMWNPLLGRPVQNFCPFGCGRPDYAEIPEGSHYVTACCRQPISTCCDGTGG